MVFGPLLALIGAFSLIFTSASSQQTCQLEFYYDLVAEFDCNGAGLTPTTAIAGSCVDISTITLPLVGKHWQAFNGKSVPTGCSVAAYADTACVTTAIVQPATTTSGCYAPSNAQTIKGAELICTAS